MTDGTLTVSELLGRVGRAVAASVPGPVWVRGEVSGFKRTSRGAAFFRLADSEVDGAALEVAARGRMMMEVDRSLDAAGVGAFRSGIEVRVRGTVALEPARSHIRLALLEVDPSFTAGRLAVGRDQVLRELAADGSLEANRRLPLPLVPLRVGLVTSRGSAAHADFLGQIRASGYRFRVSTVHASMQGETAPSSVVRGLNRLNDETIDVAALVRGGGSKLDLAAFDSLEVGRAVAAMPVPVITGVGHEIDRSVVDEAAAVAVKTPSAAGAWLVGRVADYAGRIDTARRLIRDDARAARGRAARRLDHAAALLGGVRGTIGIENSRLDGLSVGVAELAGAVIDRRSTQLDSLEEFFATIGVEDTLRRGFALVTDADSRVVRSAADVSVGQRLTVRLAAGTVSVSVEDIGD